MSQTRQLAKPFKTIAAISENGVIGAAGGIPWRIADEFAWFKKATMGHTLVMGRKTYESIGRPLPGRRMIVLSRQAREIPGVTVLPSLDQVDPMRYEGEVFIAGGAEVYRQGIPLSDELWLTTVKQTVEGDTFFPEYESLFTRQEAMVEHPLFTVWRWVRR
ncbi:dihydrofolate reductase [Verrucomicrobium sp. GAS474]|uniref:dihydrofolate reductase n=1 Tax=Verrucomicrobium sp. GAS474 TaxID=1882831 RepID=UPI00087DD0DE|nr:dihydrofolate reductase [Verrucomicrobium sp. GAS474]SDT86808.1 dihydrofolate reductase [Verrucomicrobium sp. GAS474]